MARPKQMVPIRFDKSPRNFKSLWIVSSPTAGGRLPETIHWNNARSGGYRVNARKTIAGCKIWDAICFFSKNHRAPNKTDSLLKARRFRPQSPEPPGMDRTGFLSPDMEHVPASGHPGRHEICPIHRSVRRGASFSGIAGLIHATPMLMNERAFKLASEQVPSPGKSLRTSIVLQTNPVTHEDFADAVRALVIDGVKAAKAGRSGLPPGAADIETVLFTKFPEYDAAEPQASLFASGPEVEIALAARKLLTEKGIDSRAVSVPPLELFPEQPEGTPPHSRQGFGASRPCKELYQYFGITPDAVVVEVAKALSD